MKRNYLNYRWYRLRDITTLVLTLGCAFGCGKWAKAVALLERGGMPGLGREILMAPLVAFIAYKLFTFIFDQLEEALNEHFRKEAREARYRRAVAQRNHAGSVQQSVRRCD